MDHRYTATVAWSASADEHRSGRYSRGHQWRFDGGAIVPGSSAPPVPGSDPSAVDPEEALVASVSACHMLFFLAFARQKGLVVTASGYQPDNFTLRQVNAWQWDGGFTSSNSSNVTFVHFED